MEPKTEQKPNGTRITLWLVMFAVIIAGWFALSVPKAEEETIKIGVILPLTGSGQDQGEWVRRGLELALDKLRTSNIDPAIELFYEDSKGEPKLAISAYQKLRLEQNISAMITWGSGVGLALTPLVNKDQVVQMGVATAIPSYNTPDDFTFRNFPSATLEADYLTDAVLNQLGAKQISILKINNDYGISSADAFTSRYLSKGGKVLIEETFESGSTDYRTTLTKLKQHNPRFIYLATSPKEGGLILRQAKELGL